MVSASGVAEQVKEHQEQILQQELVDLHRSLTWAFESSRGQYSKLNCFCDQPTEHLQKMPESHQLTLMTYDLINYHGRIEDASVHTILFKPSHQAVGRLLKQRLQGRLTAIVRVKCTPQPEHIAEAIYLNHRKHIQTIHAVEYIGEAATRQVARPVQGRCEERLLAITYSTDEAYDTTFTINYPTQSNTYNMPFAIVAGDKETLPGHGLDARTIQNIPQLLAPAPIIEKEAGKGSLGQAPVGDIFRL